MESPSPSFDHLSGPLHRGSTLIEASAGTGKTHAIVTLVLRLLMEHGLETKDILVVTFTKASTESLLSRIKERLQELFTYLEDALIQEKESQKPEAAPSLFPEFSEDKNQREASKLMRHLEALVKAQEPLLESTLLPSISLFHKRCEKAMGALQALQVSTIHSYCQDILQRHPLLTHAPKTWRAISGMQKDLDRIAELLWERQLLAWSHFEGPELQVLALLGFDLQSLKALLRDALASTKDSAPSAQNSASTSSQGSTPDSGPAAQNSPSASSPNSAPDSGPGINQASTPASTPAIVSTSTSASAQANFPESLPSWGPLMKAAKAILGQPFYEADKENLQHHLRRQGIRPYPISSLMWALERFEKMNLRKKDWAILEELGQNLRGHEDHSLRQQLHAFVEAHLAFQREAQDLLLKMKLQFIQDGEALYLEKEKQQGGLRFDDLLVKVRDALLDPMDGEALKGLLRAEKKAVLIDEFQDTDPIQWQIFQELYQSKEAWLFLIADPKQIIYSFRNASMDTYLKARNSVDFQSSLNTNYRGDEALISAINLLYEGNASSFSQGISFGPAEVPMPPHIPEREPQGPSVRLLWMERNRGNTSPKVRDPQTAFMGDRTGEEELPLWVARDIQKQLATPPFLKEKGRPLEASDIAIIIRQNKQAQPLLDALSKLGIPATHLGAQGLWVEDEAKALSRIFHVAEDPSLEWVRQALMSPFLYGEDDELQDELVLLWYRFFKAWHAELEQKPFFLLFHRFLKFRLRHLKERDQDFEKSLRLRDWGQMLEDLEQDGPSYSRDVFSWLKESIRQGGPPEGTSAYLPQKPENGISILTLHKAKGLEFPYVYCPYLWQKPRLPEGAEKDHLAILRAHETGHASHEDPSFQHDARLQDELYEKAVFETHQEQYRELYVALTRAQHQVSIFGGVYFALPESALGRLLFAKSPILSGRALADMKKGLKQLSYQNDQSLLRHLKSKFPAPFFEMTLLSEGDKPEAHEIKKENPDPQAEPTYKKLESRAFLRPLGPNTHWRRTSFSGLLQEGQGPYMPSPESFRAQDEKGLPEITSGSFPSSALMGNCIHSLLESISFQEKDPAALEKAALSSLSAYGLPGLYAKDLGEHISEVLNTPFDEDGTMISSLSPSKVLQELHFVFPIPSKNAFDAKGLRELFLSHQDALHEDWAEALLGLHFEDVEGLLSGSIDLVFQHPQNKKYYLADWKSNFLGPYLKDYSQEALKSAMIHHHYYLQSHIYAVALHKYLGQALGDYRPSRDFGGAYYFFLRGMSPAYPKGTGIFYERPKDDFLLSLEDFLSKTETTDA